MIDKEIKANNYYHFLLWPFYYLLTLRNNFGMSANCRPYLPVSVDDYGLFGLNESISLQPGPKSYRKPYKTSSCISNEVNSSEMKSQD